MKNWQKISLFLVRNYRHSSAFELTNGCRVSTVLICPAVVVALGTWIFDDLDVSGLWGLLRTCGYKGRLQGGCLTRGYIGDRHFAHLCNTRAKQT